MGFRAYNNRILRRAFFRLAALGLAVVGLVTIWRYSPLGEWSEPAAIGALLDDLRAHPLAGAIVVGIFLIGSFIVVPVTAMVAATGIALGPTRGLLWASIGALLASIVTYSIARALPEHKLDRWLGPWVGKMRKRFERSGLVAVMVARNVPIAPFTLINLVAGAAGIPLRDYLLGTCLGMGPMIAALTVLGDRIRGALEAPTALNVSLLGVAILAWFLLAISLQVLSNRWAAARLSRIEVSS